MMIPVIDLARYVDGTDKLGVAREIGRACEEIGFFTVANHGISIELIEQLNEAGQGFFNRPFSHKQTMTASDGMGYIGVQGENLAASLDDEAVVDLKESLNLTVPITADIWPDTPPELRQLGQQYYDALLNLSADLMRLFALALDLPETWFDDKVNDPRTILRMLNYPPVRASTDSGTTRAGAHTDYGTLTILWSPDSRGLQAKNRDGDWINIVAPKEHFIINIGDLMMNWTNDKWISTLHQVVPTADTIGKRRQSLAFFHNPNPNALIECIGEGEAKYAPILAKAHLEMKIAKSLGKDVKL